MLKIAIKALNKAQSLLHKLIERRIVEIESAELEIAQKKKELALATKMVSGVALVLTEETL